MPSARLPAAYRDRAVPGVADTDSVATTVAAGRGIVAAEGDAAAAHAFPDQAAVGRTVAGVEDPGMEVAAVHHAIVITVGTQRIGAGEVDLLAVAQPITIGVGDG